MQRNKVDRDHQKRDLLEGEKAHRPGQTDAVIFQSMRQVGTIWKSHSFLKTVISCPSEIHIRTY